MKTEADETAYFYKNVHDHLQNHKNPFIKNLSANTILQQYMSFKNKLVPKLIMKLNLNKKTDN